MTDIQALLSSSDSLQDLKGKIGQMLVMGYLGSKQDDLWCQKIAQQIQESEIGGIISFDRNVESPSQTLKLNQFFKSLAPQSLPLIIMVDQEGGLVQRLKKDKGFQTFVSPKEVAETMSPQEAKYYYQKLGQSLYDYGFNFNCGPLVDLELVTDRGVIGKFKRSFSKDPSTVIEYAKTFIDGHRAAHILTCLKHFPGHGSAWEDSHEGFTDVTPHWTEEELIPFERLIQEGYAESIMIAHTFHEKLDPLYPATLSARTLQGLLREKMGYQGILISDDLHMGAIQQKYSFEEAVLKAVEAGNDLLIFSNNPLAAQGVKDFQPQIDIPEDVAFLILTAVVENKLDPKLIESAFHRISEFKKVLIE
jgi:beta-N-acetylhexosaminidase